MKLEEIAENHGLTPEGVDYALTQYQIVICEITHGMLSKLSYDAKDIIRTAQEWWCDTCALKEQAVSYKPLKKKAINDEYHCLYNVYDCGYCGDRLREFDRFCSRCGKKVKWGD